MILQFLSDLIYFIQQSGNQRTFECSWIPAAENKEHIKQLGLKVTEKEKTLPFMYWYNWTLPFKMDKNSIGTSFITVSKICSTKQKWDVIGCRGWGEEGVSECSGCLVSIFFIFRDNWIWIMTRHHANNILLTTNLPFVFVSDSRQWSPPLMIPVHCLWAKSNNSLRIQFEFEVTSWGFVSNWTCKVKRVKEFWT